MRSIAFLAFNAIIPAVCTTVCNDIEGNGQMESKLNFFFAGPRTGKKPVTRIRFGAWLCDLIKMYEYLRRTGCIGTIEMEVDIKENKC